MMTAASPKLALRQGKRALLRRSISEALGKRFSLLYLDLIMKPVPEDLKGLLIKLDFADRPNKMR
jgi:hypothetical protein